MLLIKLLLFVFLLEIHLLNMFLSPSNRFLPRKMTNKIILTEIHLFKHVL